MQSCAEVREPIEMPLRVVSGVSRGIGVLDGMVIVEVEGAVLGVNFGHPIVSNGEILRPIGLNGQNDFFFTQKCI